MQANYKNWVPRGMMVGFGSGTAIALGISLAIYFTQKEANRVAHLVWFVIALLVAVVLFCFFAWSFVAHLVFSYRGHIRLSQKIISHVADAATIKDGQTGLDIGCGSGALTIAVAKRHPNAKMVGLDRWGKDYASFSQALCYNNAKAEGVNNVEFVQGDAIALAYPDESFDFVTSNYCYHNISGYDKQQLLRETFRVLRKGGTFAVHDLMGKSRYGDMDAFEKELKAVGFKDVKRIRTDGVWLSSFWAFLIGLRHSTLLVGTK